MAKEGDFPGSTVSAMGGEGHFRPSTGPDWRWVICWVILTTTAIPVAYFIAPALAALGLSIENLASKTGLLNGDSRAFLSLFGFVAAFAFVLAAAQWIMLRNYLSDARRWFLATAAGIFVSGLIFGVFITIVSALNWTSTWMWVILMIPVGLGLGLAQWLVLRRRVPNAFWIFIIDGLAAGSIYLSGRSITNYFELLVILLLPSTITGVGLWWLLRTSLPGALCVEPIQARPRGSISRRARIGIGLAALVPLFFVCSWAYASSQLALAKTDGVFATPEEAIIARNSQGWGGANVVKLEDVRASPNNHSGSQPHIWFGGAQVYLDRVPQGWDRAQYSSGSYYVHVRDGWVFMSEGAFPGFIGWVMELYNLEGVRQWIAAN